MLNLLIYSNIICFVLNVCTYTLLFVRVIPFTFAAEKQFKKQKRNPI